MSVRTFLTVSFATVPLLANAQNLLANASFEAIAIQPPSFSTPAPGHISNWNAAYASVLARSGYSWDGNTTFDAQSGSQYVRMDGGSVSQNAGIVQQFLTGLQVGKKYRLSFWYSGASPLASSSFSYGLGFENTSITGITGILWRPFSADFVASSTSAFVNFNGGGTASQPPVFLDNVSLTAVPEIRPVLALPFGLLVIYAVRRKTLRRT